jgi:hypothetical protein
MANQTPEAIVRNPLPATLWFLQHDARQGLLEASGFERSAPSTQPTVFHRGEFHLHAQGFWLDQGETRLVYRNPCRAFFRLPAERDPLSVPEAGEEKVGLEEGFMAVRDLLQAHEAFVLERCGRSYRNGLLQMMPISERRYGKNWKLMFGRERRPVHM